MRVVRVAAAGAVTAMALWAAWQFAVRPMICHRLKGELVNAAYRSFELRPADSAQARAIVDRLQPCFSPGCRDVRLIFIAAISWRALGRNEVALRLYNEALRYDRRPEIFVNIADTQLAMGDRTNAYENFLKAALFHPAYLMLIEDGVLRERVRAEVLRRQPEQAATIDRIEAGRFHPWNR